MAKQCDICGTEHESWQAHVFPTTTMREIRESPVRKKLADRPSDPAVGVVLCACGCGAEIELKPRYATAACRQRASRARCQKS